ncbi:MAG: inositol monophosphatase [Thermoprotei archaeon]
MNSSRDFAIILSRVAGEASGFLRDLAEEEGLDTIVGKGAGGDTTRKIDLVIEDYIISRLQQQNLDLCIVTEEKGIIKRSNKCEYYVLVDPLDGSLNYVSKIPFVSISLVVYSAEKPFIDEGIAGVVSNVFLREIYSFDLQGVYVNGTMVSRRESYNRGIVSIYTEDPYFVVKVRKILEELMNTSIKFRTLGSAALESVYAALGRIDLFIHSTGKLRNFDVACGINIAKKLGLKVLDLWGKTPKIRIDQISVIPSLIIGSYAEELVKKYIMGS